MVINLLKCNNAWETLKIEFQSSYVSQEQMIKFLWRKVVLRGLAPSDDWPSKRVGMAAVKTDHQSDRATSHWVRLLWCGCRTLAARSKALPPVLTCSYLILSIDTRLLSDNTTPVCKLNILLSKRFCSFTEILLSSLKQSNHSFERCII